MTFIGLLEQGDRYDRADGLVAEYGAGSQTGEYQGRETADASAELFQTVFDAGEHDAPFKRMRR